NVLKLAGPLRMALNIFRHGGAFAAAVTRDELIGHLFRWVTFGCLASHIDSSDGQPSVVRISLSRSNARQYRWLAAEGRMANTCAVSALVNCSKCRKASTSRSSGSMLLSAS